MVHSAIDIEFNIKRGQGHVPRLAIAVEVVERVREVSVALRDQWVPRAQKSLAFAGESSRPTRGLQVVSLVPQDGDLLAPRPNLFQALR